MLNTIQQNNRFDEVMDEVFTCKQSSAESTSFGCFVSNARRNGSNTSSASDPSNTCPAVASAAAAETLVSVVLVAEDILGVLGNDSFSFSGSGGLQHHDASVSIESRLHPLVVTEMILNLLKTLLNQSRHARSINKYFGSRSKRTTV
jgi:hypothetical protein